MTVKTQICPVRSDSPCIKCNNSWSAGMHTSCADVCPEYAAWRGKTVYLAGAIAHVTPDFATSWRRDATERLTAAGYTVLDPTQGKDLHAPGVNETVYTPKEIVEADLDMIRRADIVLAEVSKKDVPYHGTSMELVYARMWGKRIIVWGGSKSYWVRYHSERVFLTLHEALDYLEGR